MSPTPTTGRRSGERGAAAVELALVLPLLLMLVFGIIEFGRGFNAQITLTSAAREAARAAAIGADPSSAADVAAAGLDGIVVNAPADCEPGDTVEATVSYPFSYRIPFVLEKSITLTSTGAMRCAG